jgi:hypothetical protein
MISTRKIIMKMTMQYLGRYPGRICHLQDLRMIMEKRPAAACEDSSMNAWTPLDDTGQARLLDVPFPNFGTVSTKMREDALQYKATVRWYGKVPRCVWTRTRNFF